LAFLLPVDFTDGERTTVSLSGGLVGFVALRCYAEGCTFSLSGIAYKHKTTFGTSLSTNESNRRTV
jgi:hypothetical protein